MNYISDSFEESQWSASSFFFNKSDLFPGLSNSAYKE